MKPKSDEKVCTQWCMKLPTLFFSTLFSLGKVRSLSSPFSILPPSSICLLAPSDVKYLPLLSWCLEVGKVVRVELRCHQLWGSTLLLEDQQMSRRRQCPCLGLCWCGTMPSWAVTLQVLLNPVRKVMATSDEYHRFSKLDLAFCL